MLRLQNENFDLNSQIQRLDEECKDVRKENMNLKVINELIQEDNETLTQLTNTGSMMNLQLNGLEHFEKTKRQQEEMNMLKNEIEDLRQQHRKKESNMNNQIEEIRREKRKVEEENQQLLQEKRQISAQIEELHREKSTTDERNQQLQQEKYQISSEIDQLRGEKSETDKKNLQLQQEQRRNDAQIKQFCRENRQRNNENLQLRKENASKNKEIQQYEKDKNAMSNEIEQLRKEKSDMESSLQALRQECTNMRIEIEQLQNTTKSSFITESGTVNVSDFEVGRGGYAVVYKGDFHGTEVAVKEYYSVIVSSHNKKILEREINIAAQCRHPNLLQFLCATKNDQNYLLIVTELMDMTLRSLLERRGEEKSRLNNQEIKSISLDAACGLSYLHSKKPSPIIHRDISSANVLLSIERGEVKRAKISDYGSANFMEVCTSPNPGAAIYAAPEASQAKHSPKVTKKHEIKTKCNCITQTSETSAFTKNFYHLGRAKRDNWMGALLYACGF